MIMATLTKSRLSTIRPGTIFATGLIVNGKGKLNLWVAKKGRIEDWAIYMGSQGCPLQVAEHGDKIHNPIEIAKIVPCNKPVLKLYRK